MDKLRPDAPSVGREAREVMTSSPLTPEEFASRHELWKASEPKRPQKILRDRKCEDDPGFFDRLECFIDDGGEFGISNIVHKGFPELDGKKIGHLWSISREEALALAGFIWATFGD